MRESSPSISTLGSLPSQRRYYRIWRAASAYRPTTPTAVSIFSGTSWARSSLETVEAVAERDCAHIGQKNKFSVGETIEIMKPDGRNIEADVKAIFDEESRPQESAPHPQQVLYVDLGEEMEQYDILRRSEMK